jgi:hypothetical protein
MRPQMAMSFHGPVPYSSSPDFYNKEIYFLPDAISPLQQDVSF